MAEGTRTKICSVCKRALPITRFHPHRHGKNGVRASCKECFIKATGMARKSRKLRMDAHCLQRYRHMIRNTPKRCSSCQKELPRSDFHIYRAAKDGLCHYCKACLSNKRRQRCDKDHGAGERNSSLRSKYGITAADYETMLVAQKAVCAICGCPASDFKSRFAVDHDHKTGTIRGLLCFHCNSGIGHFRDDVILLASAIGYLKHPVGHVPALTPSSID